MLHVAGYQMHTGRWRRETIDRPFACSQKHRKDSAQAYVRHQMEGPSSTGPADIAEPAGGDVERGTQHGSPFVNMEGRQHHHEPELQRILLRSPVVKISVPFDVDASELPAITHATVTPR